MSNTIAPMSEAMYYVMLALAKPNHGYQLMSTVEIISGGRVQIGPGTLYGILTRLEKENFIVVVSDDGRRKTYEITTDGEKALYKEYNRLVAMVNDGQWMEGKYGKHDKN